MERSRAMPQADLETLRAGYEAFSQRARALEAVGLEE
jgi:hypothetical protein